jgi:flagellar biosynthesis protein
VKRAVALRYDENADYAPVVVSAGHGVLAAHIERAAADYGIPVVRDVPLASALFELKVGDQIPETLYEAVAALLNEIGPGPARD